MPILNLDDLLYLNWMEQQEQSNDNEDEEEE